MPSTVSTEFAVPDLLQDIIEISDPYENYSSTGKLSSFGVDLCLRELRLSKTIKSSEFRLLGGKIQEALRVWEEKYKRHLDKTRKENRAEYAEELTIEAEKTRKELNSLLLHTLSVDDTVDWDKIKRKDHFRTTAKQLLENGTDDIDYIVFNAAGKPTSFETVANPTKPDFEEHRKSIGFLSRNLFKSRVKASFDLKTQKYLREKNRIDGVNAAREAKFNEIFGRYRTRKTEFDETKKIDNDAIDALKSRYLEKDPRAIEEYCDLVLSSSRYPDFFPSEWALEYRPESKLLIVEYTLVPPAALPTIEYYKYVKSRDEITEKHSTTGAMKKLYDSVIYQICIRTIHEIFEAEKLDAIHAVAFNGFVTNLNPATGIDETKIILSIMADREQFETFNLASVDPKATFKLMKGVSASSLIDLTPVPPIINIEKTDKRFIKSKNVVGNLDDTVNLAAMHWEEFEHLVRELFEKEFAVNGGEVKVTQASSDGGVDAIAFDPDPLRGGKIVIQAKRYTNVVGVSAVRDLYGTLMNEGATKGILVTTTDYGKDSYEFAKGKPLTLLSGSNLLSLLEKHGHKARINVAEAKKLISSQL